MENIERNNDIIFHMYYTDVIEAMNKNGVRYLVVGGVAVVLHGVLRMTADLDLMIDLEKDNIIRFLDTIKKLDYRPKLPIDPLLFIDPVIRKEWIEQKNMKVFSFINTKQDYKIVDIFTDEQISFKAAFQRKQVLKAKDISINVISFDDLIALKRLSARTQDDLDIRMLEQMREEYGKRNG